MSQERKRARAAREQARAAEVAAAAARRDRAARRAAVRDRLVPEVPRRRRRYGALPIRVVAQLIALFGAVQVVAFVFADAWTTRVSVAVLSAAVLLVHAKTRRSNTR